MPHRPQNFWLGRVSWQLVKRWPIVYVLGCCLGLFIGIGCLYSFWDPQSNDRKTLALKPLGLLMLALYGWFLIAFIVKLTQRTWQNHCDHRIAFFSGPQGPAKPSPVLRISDRSILVASLIVLGAMAEVLCGVQHHWRDPLTNMLFGLSWLISPLLSYVAIRRVTETGFTPPWLFSVLISLAGLALLACSFYYLIHRNT